MSKMVKQSVLWLGIILGGIGLVSLSFSLGIRLSNPSSSRSFGSVAQGSEYRSTTTPVIATNFPAIYLLSGATTTVTAGSLGSVTITKTDTGTIGFYDATTTDINMRTGNLATSTIQIAFFPASPTAGTYVFDSQYYKALLVVTSGSIASSTFTWR